MQQTSHLIALLGLVPALAFAIAAALAKAQKLNWNRAIMLCVAVLAVAITIPMLTLWAGDSQSTNLWYSQSPLSQLMLILVAFLGFIILRFSQRYLEGEPRTQDFLCWLLCTLSAVSLVVSSNHLLMLVAGWAAISLGLHQLLLFYPDRPRAVLAAHKKFIFARLAELSLLAAAVLLYRVHETWLISEIIAAFPRESLTVSEQVAALLLALTALIKCAQLPVHGWLMQVVEAPTPVSALLHAGIINLGGYLLLIFAPLMLQAVWAQALILTVAGLTTVLAALVMSTRVSVKVKLAWSTSAQMGLMLIECALGLYELALLHLVAHACYKAYAFLNAGSAVEAHLVQRLAPARAIPVRQWLTNGIAIAGLMALVYILGNISGPFAPWLLLALAITVIVTERSSDRFLASLPLYAGVAGLISLAYLVQKTLIGHWLTFSANINPVADLWACLLFLSLAVLYAGLRADVVNPNVRRLRVWLFAGFYLDEWVTRTTLRIWPGQLGLKSAATSLPNWKQEIES